MPGGNELVDVGPKFGNSARECVEALLPGEGSLAFASGLRLRGRTRLFTSAFQPQRFGSGPKGAPCSAQRFGEPT